MAKQAVIGLDIGATHVRAAEVERSGRGAPTLVRYGQIPLPLGAVRDGEVAEPETVASALRQLWSKHKFGSRDVALGIGNQRVLVRELEMPAMPMAQIRTSLPFQVQDLLPVAVEDALLDYYPTDEFQGPNGPMVGGLLVAATKDTVRANTIAAESAGLRPMIVDLSAFALARVHSVGDVAGRTIALVDVGARITTIVVIANGVPRFIRMLPSGGQDVTDAVTAAMGVPAAEAERIKRELGVGMAAAPDLAHVAQGVHQVTSALIDSVRNTLVYYASTHPGAAADGVLLSGGGSMLPGFGQFLASASRLPVAIAQPLTPFRQGRSAPGAAELNAIQHECSFAVGLAMGVAA